MAIPVSTRLARQGCAGRRSRSSRPRSPRERVDARLVDARLDVRMHDVALRRGAQSGAEVVEVVAIGAGRDRCPASPRGCARRDSSCSSSSDRPGSRDSAASACSPASSTTSGQPCVAACASTRAARRRRHRRSRRVIHRRPGAANRARDVRERHRVDAAADGDARVADGGRARRRGARAASSRSLGSCVLQRALALPSARALAGARRGPRIAATSSCAALAVRLPPGRCATLTCDVGAVDRRRDLGSAQHAPALLAQAQSQRRGFGEAGLRDRVGGIRPGEQAELRRAAVPSCHAACRPTRRGRRSASAGDRRRPRSPRRSCRRRRTRAPRRRRHRRRQRSTRALEHERAHDVGHPGQRARSRAAAGAQQAAGLAARAALRRGHEMPQDRGTRGRHALAGDAVVVPRIARQQQARRGRRAPAAGRAPCARVPPPRGSDVRRPVRAVELAPRCIRPRRCPAANPSPRARGSAPGRPPCRAPAPPHRPEARAAPARVRALAADSGASPICRRSDAYGVPACSCAAPAITLTSARRRRRYDAGARPKRRARNPPLAASANSGAALAGRPHGRKLGQHRRGERAAAHRPSRRRTCRRLMPPTRSRWIASEAGGGSAALRQATTGTTYGPSGMTATARSPARASAAASAASTEAIVSTPVRLRSSASRPVV